MSWRFVLGALAYLLPSFPLGYAWHLVIFKPYYDALAIYRPEVIVPLGLASMLVQCLLWAYLYQRLFATERMLAGAAKFAGLGMAMAWSFVVLPVAAKYPMTSVADFIQIETAFVVVQYLLVSPLMALAFSYRR